MKRIFRHMLPFWPQILAAAILMTLSSLSQLLLPTFMSGVVNEGVYEKDFSVILEYCGQMLAVALVGGDGIGPEVQRGGCGGIQRQFAGGGISQGDEYEP